MRVEDTGGEVGVKLTRIALVFISGINVGLGIARIATNDGTAIGMFTIAVFTFVGVLNASQLMKDCRKHEARDVR